MGLKSRITVPPENEGDRIDVFLSGYFADISRARIQKGVGSGDIIKDGLETKKSEPVSAGSVIDVLDSFEEERESGYPEAQGIPLEVIYKDRYIAAVNKPPGLCVHPGAGRRDRTLVNALVYHFTELSQGPDSERPGIVHRLDMDTSGVILVALNNSVHAKLSEMFAQRSIHKTYKAFCIGKRPENKGDITGAIRRHCKHRQIFCVQSGGKDARTRYRLEGYRSGISLISFYPETGRTHQIRVHSSWSGFPVVGDTGYGGGRAVLKSLPPENRAFASEFCNLFHRQALHAHKISFIHPVTSEEVVLKAPFPEDFRKGLELLQRE
ncbi:MAG: RluA family pseudouridine synthase [Chitinivibrionales bacterium]